MGITTALNTTVGSYQIFKMYKLLVAAAVAVCGTAEAEPGYGYLATPALYNTYPNWPGVSTPYSQSTCYGCYGKRSADAEPEADAYYGYGYAPYGYGYPYRYYGKRSADAEAEPEADAYYGYGYAPYAYGYRRAYGYGYPYRYYGKRSADAEPEADAAYYGYAAYAPYSYGYGLGVAAHPGYATSFVARSPQGLGKRSAEPFYGYGVVPVSRATFGYGPSTYGIAQGHPGAASSFQAVTRFH